MKNLMFRWMDSRLMEEAGGTGGGGNPPANGGGNPPANGGGTPPANGGGNPPANGGGNPPANGGGNPPANGGGNPLANGGGNPLANGGGNPPANGGDKPFLGGKTPANGNQPPANGNQPPANAPDEKAYLDAIKKDEQLFGKDDNLVFDQNLVKAVIPTCQKYGISTEAANAIANAFAKAQVDGARAAYKERCDYFTKMNDAARAKYSDADFEQINAGIDRWFKPGGIMNNVIRNSELGADPEFLALMHELGKAAKEDKGEGAAAGGGEGTGDPNGSAGLSKIWK